MRVSIILLLLLSACASGLQEYAGDPPPKNYKTVISGDFLQRFSQKYLLTDLTISPPEPGARDVVSGWRVCVLATPRDPANTTVVPIAYFFVDKSLENVTEGDVRCNTAQYEPWPDVAHAEGWSRR